MYSTISKKIKQFDESKIDEIMEATSKSIECINSIQQKLNECKSSIDFLYKSVPRQEIAQLTSVISSSDIKVFEGSLERLKGLMTSINAKMATIKEATSIIK